MLRIKNKRGFTIVETLIVLAIVGAIMLVVFLAVPALQRNSRNTSLKNDVSNLISAISEFSTNHNGKLPTNMDEDGNGNFTFYTTSADSGSVAQINGGTDVNFFDDGSLNSFPTDFGTINIGTGVKCDTTGDDPVLTTSNRSVAAAFLVETASGSVKQCVNG